MIVGCGSGYNENVKKNHKHGEKNEHTLDINPNNKPTYVLNLDNPDFLDEITQNPIYKENGRYQKIVMEGLPVNRLYKEEIFNNLRELLVPGGILIMDNAPIYLYNKDKTFVGPIENTKIVYGPLHGYQITQECKDNLYILGTFELLDIQRTPFFEMFRNANDIRNQKINEGATLKELNQQKDDIKKKYIKDFFHKIGFEVINYGDNDRSYRNIMVKKIE